MHAEPSEPAAGISPHQIAEVLVTTSGRAARRGSGYRVGERAVLTAAHVVADAASVRVRFDADRDGEWMVEAQRVLMDDASDLAVVVVDPPEGAPAAVRADFARVGDVATEIAVAAAGFPRFKLRSYGGELSGSVYRDLHQAAGTVAALSNRRSGSFEVTVRAPERDPDAALSPWEGMSGAALWADGRIVGVVTDHHRADGLGRLAAGRIDRFLERLARKGTKQGSAEAAELAAVLGLPATAADLPDVTAAAARDLPATSYRAQIADIAPRRLLGREAELAELAAPATGGAEAYTWWQAPPWAGKTALMASFALHAPPDVDVVAFFVASALAGQSDGDAFVEAMSEQLTSLARLAPGAPETTAARRRNFLALLAAAADRSRAAGRRIVVVVDALDEDSGAAAGKPSIASLLPRHLPDGVRVVVSSRSDRPLPLDVPADHPLQRCPRRALTVSPHATADEVFARRELNERLRGGALQEDLLGLITASGGGLGRDDLAELTRESPFRVEELLQGTFGHSVGTRVQRLAGSAAARETRGYLLAHRTLQEVAEEAFGARLEHHRDRLHAWAERHRGDGWPADTPQYLLRDYARMLATAGDAPRLAALAADVVRHDRMLEVTGGDALALDEIALAQAAGLQRDEPDLVALVLLAVRREELVGRNTGIPPRLPAVWAALGRLVRAEALARGVPQHGRRDAALASAAVAAARAGHAGGAEQLAGGIVDAEQREATLVDVAVAAAAYDVNRAERILRSVTPVLVDAALVRLAPVVAARDPGRAAALLLALAVEPRGAQARTADALVAAAGGELDAAEAVVETITPVARRARARAQLAVAVAAAGDLPRAERIATSVRRSGLRLRLYADLLRHVAPDAPDAVVERLVAALRSVADAAGHHGEAIETLLDTAAVLRRAGRGAAADVLVADADGIAERMTDPGRRQWALARLALARVQAGDRDAAEAALGGLGDPDRVAAALTAIAVAAAEHGEQERAEAAVRRLPPGYRRMLALTDLAAVQAAAGAHEQAERHALEVELLARDTAEPRRLAALTARVLDGLTEAGEFTTAGLVAGQLSDPQQRATALIRVAEALARSGDVTAARRVATGVTEEPEQRVWLRVAECAGHAAAGRRAEAMGAADAVCAALEHVGDGYSRLVALVRLAGALRTADAPDEARRMVDAADGEVDGIPDAGQRARALAHLALARAAGGDDAGAADLLAQVEATTAAVDGASRRDRARTRVAEVLAAAGEVERAEAVAAGIDGPAGRVRALAAAVSAGSGDRAWVLLERAEADLALVTDEQERGALTGRLAGAAADVLARSGEADGRGPRRSWLTGIVADLLVSDSWIDAVPALARLDRRAFDAVVTWLVARAGTPFTGPASSFHLNSSPTFGRRGAS